MDDDDDNDDAQIYLSFFWLQEMHPLGDSSAHCFGTAGKQFMEM